MGNTGGCVRCGLREGALLPCAVCGAPHHANCFSAIGRCAVPACAGKELGGAAPVIPLAGAPGAALPGGPSSPGSSPGVIGRFVIDFESHRERALLWAGHAFAFLAVTMAVIGANHLVFLGLFTVAITAYTLRGNLEDRWVIDGPAGTIWLETRFFGSTTLEPYAAFKDLTDLTLTQHADFQTLPQIPPMTGSEIALYAVTGVRSYAGRRPMAFLQQLEWHLSLGVSDGRRIELWWPETTRGKPSDHLVGIVRVLEKVTGLKLQIRAAPPRPL